MLFKYTIAGDADLDGRITANDFALTDAGFLFGGTTWANGDFDYSGTVTIFDKAIIDNDFLNQGGNTLADDDLANAIIAQDIANFGPAFELALDGFRQSSTTGGAEPASLSLLALGAVSLLKRRRR